MARALAVDVSVVSLTNAVLLHIFLFRLQLTFRPGTSRTTHAGTPVARDFHGKETDRANQKKKKKKEEEKNKTK